MVGDAPSIGVPSPPLPPSERGGNLECAPRPPQWERGWGEGVKFNHHDKQRLAVVYC